MVETYTVSTAFINGVDCGTLLLEIEDDVSIAKDVTGVTSENDICYISFKSALSVPEKSALDAIVAAHQRDPALDGIDIKGVGRIYNKSGTSAIYWKPYNGSEIDLTVANANTTSAAASDLVTSSSSGYFFVNGMRVTAPANGRYEIRLSTSVETSTNSVIAEIVFYKNGSIIEGPYVLCGGIASIYPTCLSSVQTLSSGDVVTVYAKQSSGNGNYKLYYRQLTLLQLS